MAAIGLQMVRAGMFGELKHGGAAYNHDLRSILFETRDEGLWRRAAHLSRNGNLYPTHGLGPVAWYLGIDHGDRFDYMVSMSTPEFGLTKWREDHIPKDDPRWKEKYVNGDLNSSLIKTAKGRTIRLEHNVSSPRPYSRINSIEGTKGLFEDYPHGLAAGHMPARRARARHERLRRSGVERAGSALGEVGGDGKRTGEVPRLHPRQLTQGSVTLSCSRSPTSDRACWTRRIWATWPAAACRRLPSAPRRRSDRRERE